MKLKTIKEIESLAVNHANFYTTPENHDWHGRYSSYKNSYIKAQQDLLSQASEGFEEWHKNHEYFEGVLDFNETNIVGLRPINSSDVYENAKEAWQAAKMSSAKEIDELKKENEELKKDFFETVKPIPATLNMDDIEEHFKMLREKWNLPEIPNSLKEGV